MTTFFIPGMGDERGVIERAYGDMRRQVEVEIGRRPNVRRIAKLWTRRGSLDCVTEVGAPDPVRGGTVVAIFDLGRHEPFVVWWRPQGGVPSGVREVLGPHAYSVVEFDA